MHLFLWISLLKRRRLCSSRPGIFISKWPSVVRCAISRDQPIPPSVLEHAILAAGSAPSGANMQPWHFAVVQDAAIKKKIRQAAEIEERELYEHRASEEWLDALAPLGTDANKPFLETAPALIAIFLKKVHY